ncbi:MAG: hypothetical protein CK532_03725 [Flavobacteriales bacterium]|nr:MAG: hypothetical protein CK532_03725 [Flavobacteriales bacterium]
MFTQNKGNGGFLVLAIAKKGSADGPLPTINNGSPFNAFTGLIQRDLMRILAMLSRVLKNTVLQIKFF